MKKPFKVLSTTAMAAALSASVLVPAAVFAAEDTVAVSHYVIEVEGKLVALSVDDFKDLKAAGIVTGSAAQYVEAGSSFYALKDFTDAKAAIGNNPTQDVVLALLAEEGLDADVEVYEAVIGEDGTISPGDLKNQPAPVKLAVESVSAISTTAVDVTITAPEEDVLGATIEVKDGAGNVVEVNPVDISAGDTVASFTFKTAVKAEDLTGVWTVAGNEYSFDLINQLADITEAASATPFNELTLYNALEAAGIQNIDDNRLKAYADEIVDASPESLADVQKAVDTVNKNATETADQAAAVKAVKEATNQIQLLNALKANFDRVNANWIAAYAGGKQGVDTPPAVTSTAGFIIDTDKDVDNEAVLDHGKNAAGSAPIDTYDFEDIQDLIDTVNEVQVSKAYDKAFQSLKSADVNAARTLANEYLTTAKEEGDRDAKAWANDSLDILDALIRVNAATTNNTLKSALVALDELDTKLFKKYENNTHGITVTEDFDIEDVKDSLLADYRKAIADAEVGDKNQRGDIQQIIDDVNQDAADTQLDKVTNATTADELLKALKAYPGVKQVEDINKTSYWDTANANFDSVTNLATVQAAVDTANLDAVENATVSNIIAKLNVFGLDNVIAANAVAYENAKTTLGGATVGATNAATVQNLKILVAAENKTVTVAAQVKAINDAETVLEVKTALDALANVDEVADYLKIRSVDRDFVAAYVLDEKPQGGYVAAGGTVLDAIDAEVTNAQGAYAAALTGINGLTLTSTPDEVVTELAKMLDEDFAALNNVEKSEAAQAFHEKLVFIEDGTALKTPFITLSAVKALLK